LRTLTYWHDRESDRQIATIFWGGGTPSLLSPAAVERVLSHIQGLWPILPDCEITLEANPTTHETARFNGLRAAGINRLSVGIQSFEQAELDYLGRTYTVVEAERALAHIAETFPRFSFDMIYALPAHTLPQWQAQLERALRYAGEHLSLYQLTFEPGTRFYQALQTGRMHALDEDTAADLYSWTVDRMAAAGLPQYEISNYARPGQESRHNMVYWQGGDWIGVGPGAHGRLGQTEHRRALTNLRSPEKWRDDVEAGQPGVEQDEAVPQNEVGEELAMTGLRLASGINRKRFATVAGYPLEATIAQAKQQSLVAEGLAWSDAGGFGLTPGGRMLLDSAIGFLLTSDDHY
jgi:putative oxygen-independent coproporphyrinogen III oxidase